MVSSDWPSHIFEKKNWLPEFGPNGPKSGPKLDFLPISQVWFISFPWDLIQWKLKIFRAQIWTKVAKIGPKTSFFCHFLKFCALVFLEIADNDSLQWCITSSRGKTYKVFLGGDQVWAKIRPETRFSTVFSSVIHYFSLELNTVIACNND